MLVDDAQNVHDVYKISESQTSMLSWYVLTRLAITLGVVGHALQFAFSKLAHLVIYSAGVVDRATHLEYVHLKLTANINKD